MNNKESELKEKKMNGAGLKNCGMRLELGKSEKCSTNSLDYKQQNHKV